RALAGRAPKRPRQDRAMAGLAQALAAPVFRPHVRARRCVAAGDHVGRAQAVRDEGHAAVRALPLRRLPRALAERARPRLRRRARRRRPRAEPELLHPLAHRRRRREADRALRGRAGRILPHPLAPGTSLFYGDAHGEYSPARFVDLFREIDDVLAKLAIRPSRILSDHDHGWSAHAIPGLLQRGITY